MRARSDSGGKVAATLVLVGVAAIPWGGLAAGGEAGAETGAGFTDVATEVGLTFVHQPGVEGEYWMPESIGSGGAVGDIDGDGDLDVYVTNVGADRLYENRGDGSFADATTAAGIEEADWSASAAFLDHDLDGDLDLYVVDYVAFDPAVVCADAAGRRDYCGPAGFAGVADHLWRNDGGGRFTDVSGPAGIAAVARKGLGVVAADLDGDARPDLYVANDGEANLLWINRGDGRFEDRAVELGAAVNLLGRPEAGMGIALGDADGDGASDLLVTHLRGESNTLYRSLGAAAGGAGSGLGLADATLEAGLAGPSLPWTGFGTSFLDADHDGDLDLAVVNGRVTRGPLQAPVPAAAGPAAYWAPYAEPDLLFLNDGAGRFAAAGSGAGFAALPPGNGRGLASGDVDGDGDLDLLVTQEGGPVRLLRNDLWAAGGAPRHWLRVRLEEAGGGRDGAGAEVAVRAAGRVQVRPAATGGSFLSAGDPALHFGLGEGSVVEALTVRWPGGRRLRLLGLPADRLVVVRRPAAEAAP